MHSCPCQELSASSRRKTQARKQRNQSPLGGGSKLESNLRAFKPAETEQGSLRQLKFRNTEFSLILY